LTPTQIRDADLPRVRRGFDEAATKSLLAAAASALSTAIRERDEFKNKNDELRANIAAPPPDAETIGAVLVTAHRTAEELVAKAVEEAAGMQAAAESQRDMILLEARELADAMLAEATVAIDTLRGSEEELRRSITERRQQLSTFLRWALTQIDNAESAGSNMAGMGTSRAAEPGLDSELLAQLPPE
jgi:cell division septum initiation protein DivIVA